MMDYVNKKPVLGICYGAQLLSKQFGGKVEKSATREYGRATLKLKEEFAPKIPHTSTVWMSHADTITQLPEQFEIVGTTESIPVAFFKNKNGAFQMPVWGVQFHPEVTHSDHGKEILAEYVYDVCGCAPTWTSDAFAESSINNLKAQIGNDEVILALSGGVDSSVAAGLLHRAIGKNLHCVFVDNGLLRKDEFENVLKSYELMGLNIKGVDAKQLFYDNLQGVSDPEQKRKIIGKTFIDVFEAESHHLPEVKWLAQGTIYPDVIESSSVHGPSQTIKSHHNVGGLPEKLKLKIVEPLRLLFKDEVRRVGKALNIPSDILGRHPFPGPGLGIRIMGDVTPEKVKILQDADAIYMNGLRNSDLYDSIWQAGAILTSVKTVGVMGDERTYEHVLALRAVTSLDGMTADWVHLPYDFLQRISNEIINNVRGINRVVYDISSKPPATIEWE